MMPYKQSDSIEAKFGKASKVHSVGGTQTRKRMGTTFRAFEAAAKIGRWGDVSPETLTKKQFMRFIEARKEHITTHCLKIESAHIRRALRGVERDDFAKAVTNNVLGIPKGTRIGTGTATAPEVLAHARGAAPENVRILIDLCDGVGLRIREGVCCTQSLKIWKIEMEHGQPLSVEFGTKGGRPRAVFLRDQNSRALARDAVGRAILWLEESGEEFLIPSVSLQGAIRKAEREFAALGLKADDSAHSLRRDFAVREYDQMRREAIAHRDALCRLSIALGHGSSRHRWVWNNYLRATLEARNDG